MKLQRTFINFAVLGLLAILAGCGEIPPIQVHEVANGATQQIAQAPTVQICSTMADMPGTQNCVNVSGNVAPPAQGNANPTETEPFVVDWLLFGTPTQTPTPKGFVAPTQVPPTSIPTLPPTVAVSPSAAVPATATLPPTETLPSTATSASNANAAPSGDPVAGKQIFTTIGTCSTCHDTENGIRIVGPSLKGVAERAGTRKSGMSAHDYLYESITKPNAYVVDGFPSGVMPQDFAQRFTSQQIEDLIAYLLTLK